MGSDTAEARLKKLAETRRKLAVSQAGRGGCGEDDATVTVPLSDLSALLLRSEDQERLIGESAELIERLRPGCCIGHPVACGTPYTTGEFAELCCLSASLLSSLERAG
jgi:hypothetical protein